MVRYIIILTILTLTLSVTACSGDGGSFIDKKSDEEVKIEFTDPNENKETAISIHFAEDISEKELYELAESFDVEVGGYFPPTNAARFIYKSTKEETINTKIEEIKQNTKIEDVFKSKQ